MSRSSSDHDVYIGWRRDLLRLRRELYVGGLIDVFMEESPLWKQFLEPLLSEKVTRFQEVDAWKAPVHPQGEQPSLERLRGQAEQAKHIREAFDSRRGKRDTILAEIEKVTERIQTARKSGKIPAEWDDEAI